MSKILFLSKAAGVAVVSAVLLFGLLPSAVAEAVALPGGVATGVVADAPQDTTPRAVTPRGGAAVQPTSETRAIVVGGLSFVLMIAAAGAVLWHTARSRHPGE
ncbi:hypothetical protein LWP59_33435 [Amycolatopsis acidiphila]|uniref:Uncharacterized protein n=1 Tax=Amycolatopsis acidiphila TaxID=715473 RepID=A0A558A4C2_9PSEU|nr:hypothetical protein [Amycolatopsis acidiphila]TVT19111.1 hypothetical protein FNH06_25355 [Amycolatopsis acidiphila]UIJ58933.1 hypothetical protein LWP59_33435 [Amycolatopsis acidiphila]GHG72859.1 hypothetical protein GCM10017788_35710 [Amycolatopsis acidiphila]